MNFYVCQRRLHSATGSNQSTLPAAPRGDKAPCAGCHRLRAVLPVTVASARHLLCSACRGALRGRRIPSRMLAPAANADRDWFASRFGRTHRLRLPIAGEVFVGPEASNDAIKVVAVRQLGAGVQTKIALLWPGTEPPPNSEELARKIFAFGIGIATPIDDWIRDRGVEP